MEVFSSFSDSVVLWKLANATGPRVVLLLQDLYGSFACIIIRRQRKKINPGDFEGKPPNVVQ